MKNYRHGDLVLEGIEKLPDNLQKTNTKILMTGSQNNPHSIDGGDVYFKGENEFVFGYLAAKNTTLFHKEHGEGKAAVKRAKIDDGIYRLRRQNEILHEGMRQVID